MAIDLKLLQIRIYLGVRFDLAGFNSATGALPVWFCSGWPPLSHVETCRYLFLRHTRASSQDVFVFLHVMALSPWDLVIAGCMAPHRSSVLPEMLVTVVPCELVVGQPVLLV